MTEGIAIGMNNKTNYIAAGYVCLDILPILSSAIKLEDMTVPGKLVEIGGARTNTGGSVSNTGAALHRLGHNVKLIGKIGDDAFGRIVADTFRRISPKLADSIVVDKSVATSYSICIQPAGVDRIFWTCAGGNGKFSSADVSDAELASADHMHFGYPPLMMRMCENDGSELVTLFKRAKDAGLTTSLDMSLPDPGGVSGRIDWRRLLSRVLPYVDIYAPSLEETVFMLDRAKFADVQRNASHGISLGGLSVHNVKTYAADILGMGTAIVLLKLGKDGAYTAATSDRIRLERCGRGGPFDVDAWLGAAYHQPCFSVKVRSTTGSGDCTIAGFLAAVGRGAGPREAVRMAVAVGSTLVELETGAAGLPDYDSIAARFASAGFPCDNAPLFDI